MIMFCAYYLFALHVERCHCPLSFWRAFSAAVGLFIHYTSARAQGRVVILSS